MYGAAHHIPSSCAQWGLERKSPAKSFERRGNIPLQCYKLCCGRDTERTMKEPPSSGAQHRAPRVAILTALGSSGHAIPSEWPPFATSNVQDGHGKRFTGGAPSKKKRTSSSTETLPPIVMLSQMLKHDTDGGTSGLKPYE